jgi:nicotinate-nucleotide adenylyltransferase
MIGVLGGTFDPIHYGHLRIALDAMESLGLSQVRFLPLHQAVHREQPRASAEQRLAMVRLAIAGQVGFVLDDSECQRQGPSYMLDTLRQLRQQLGEPQLALLLGSDAFQGFLAWREPHNVLGLCHLVVLGRPGYRLPETGELGALAARHGVTDAQELRRHPSGKILCQPVTQLEISASDIRQRIAARRSPRYLLPEVVLDLIEREALYRAN